MVELFYAEDDADIAGVVKEYLEQKNFKVVIYHTISEVRQALESHVPTVILLDWNHTDNTNICRTKDCLICILFCHCVATYY